MDFRNLCQKIDVDSIRAKIPAMPATPALPQLKLPKSMPKLKLRKIFRSSREDVNQASTKQQNQQLQQQYGMQQYPSMQQMQSPIPPADFINHTPTRISTISSLMHQGSQEQPQFDGGRTYRSACSFNDEDYPSPTTTTAQYDRRRRRGVDDDYNQPDISPLRTSRHSLPKINSPVGGSNANVKMSLTEKLQKGYRDFSEFKLKHIFAKKTVVRKDNIEVDNYVQRYDEDRVREQQEQDRRDREVADNYNFKFKISRQNTGHSESVSPSDSPVFGVQNKDDKMSTTVGHKTGKSVGEQSGDESGMEATPPKRGQGLAAATRFGARPRHQKSEDSNSQEESDIEYDTEVSKAPQPIARDCWSTRGNRTPVEATASPITKAEEKREVKVTGYKERMRRLTSYVSSHDESGAESNPDGSGASGGAKVVLSKLRGLGRRNTEESGEATGGTKRKAPLTPQQSDEQLDEKSSDKPINSIKHNFRRLQKSMKRQPTAATEDSEDEETPRKETKTLTKTEKLTARLRRFKSREASIDNLENDESGTPKTNDGRKSPLRSVISNKLQTWKKSFKKQPKDTVARTDDEEDEEQDSPTVKPQKRSDTLMNKLKYIRSRKHPNSADELDTAEGDDETATAKSKDGATRKPLNLEEKFEQARQRTMKKVNEKMQQMKFFHKSQEHVEKEQVAIKNNNRNRNSSDEDEVEEEQEYDTRAQANVPPTIARRGGGLIQQDHHLYELNPEQDDIEEFTNIQHEYATHRTRWTTNPLLNESMDSDTESEFPRVLIHQDNSDLFESTLIIAVTRPASVSPSPKITEIRSETHTPILIAKPAEWKSNKEIITGFLEVTPPNKRKASVEAIVVTANTTRGHTRKLSMDSNNSDSDSWIPAETVRNKQFSSSQESSRRASTAGLISIEENEEPWKVHSMFREEKLYKAKSIDIFEVSSNMGGATAAFEGFDDELRNEPVVKIVCGGHQNIDSFEKDSSEDPEAADDDNSSRITKILVEAIKEEDEEVSPRITITTEIRKNAAPSQEEHQLRQIGNSRESLDANFDDNEEMDSDDIDDDDDEDEYDEDDRPPSVSPPPPPLPQRQPSIRITKPQAVVVDVAPLMAATPMVILPMTASPTATPPPPLPATKPPLPLHKPQAVPPKIPERTASMTRIAKPLVKTSSLRLAYNEQVKPADVGKVNKLISRFEQPNINTFEGRPRLIPRRRPMRGDSEDYSDEDEEEDDEDDLDSDEDEDSSDVAYEKDGKYAKAHMERDITPTNQLPHPRTDSAESPREDIKTIKVVPIKRMAPAPVITLVSNIGTREQIVPVTLGNTEARHEESHNQVQRSIINLKSPINIPTIALNLDSNSNYSRPSSEYGSPLAYPSSLKGSAETTPIPDRRLQQQLEMRRTERSRRSMTRDNENFYSFDSDEENSYYSISPSGSSRYVVEI